MDILIKVYIGSYIVCIFIVTNAVIHKEDFILQQYNQHFIVHLESKEFGTYIKNKILTF